MATAFDALNLGLQYHRAGRLSEAEAIYREVLESDPDNPDASHLFGVLAHQIGRHDVAVEAMAWAISLKGDRPDFHNNIGEAYRALKRYPEAVAHYRKALELKPDYADAFNNLGLAFKDIGRPDEAVAAYEQALACQMNFPEAYNNLGNVFQELRQLDQAVTYYRMALVLRPDFPEAHNNLANSLKEQGCQDEAVAHYDKALALRPNYPMARFGKCMAQLPVLYQDEAEIERRRAAYTEHLAQLIAYVDGETRATPALSEAVGSSQPFFLAYQGQNDRALQARYGAMVARIMARRYPEPPTALPSVGRDERVRVGFVSGYFYNHSNWKSPIKGWLTQLDPHRFEVFCYHTRAQRDAETAIAEQSCDRFVQGPLPLDQWRSRILEDAPHVLVFPETGMDPVTVQLACQRLAKVQCTSWGHPDTSGLPTIDYFLGSDLMEPENGADHYTETLVRLPNLSCYYGPFAAPTETVTREELGLRSDAVIYWCCQSLFKYLPQHDHVFPEIARAVGRSCQFAFLGSQGGEHVGEMFQRRMAKAFQAHGLWAPDHCVFLPRLSPQRFIATGAVCDVFLDSIGWSGINTTLEAMVSDLPVVTLPGVLMRGRHSAAVLRMIDVTETIADSHSSYVAIAARLGTDATWRAAVRKRIAANKERLTKDTTCIEALETFLETVAAQ